MNISEPDAYKIGMLSERAQRHQAVVESASNEIRAILLKYKIDAAPWLTVVTDPSKFPIGTVVDGRTGLPLEQPKTEATAVEED